MTTVEHARPRIPAGPAARLALTLRDGFTIVRREMWHLRNEPIQIIMPLVFSGALVILFGYIFGSAIAVPGGGDYREYLMPGLFVMASVTPLMLNAMSIAREKDKGVMDRFRAMPMSRLAVPFGWTGADVLIGVISLAATSLVGLLVGWRAHGGVGDIVTAYLLLMLFRYAMAWIGVFVGLAMTGETLDSVAPLFFPFVMISNAFVPTHNMVGRLRTIANWNPVSAVAQAARRLFGNPGVALQDPPWPLQHPVAAAIMWSLALILVFAALSAREYVRSER